MTVAKYARYRGGRCVVVVVGTSTSVGAAGGAGAGDENGVARVWARGAAFSADGGFRLEAAEEGP